MLFEDYNYTPYNKYVLVDPAHEDAESEGEGAESEEVEDDCSVDDCGHDKIEYE